MDKIIKTDYGFRVLKGYRTRAMTNEERYEGAIRSDFRSRMIVEYDEIIFEHENHVPFFRVIKNKNGQPSWKYISSLKQNE